MGNTFTLYTSEPAITVDGKKPMLNSYATWSVGFYALYKAAIADEPLFTENQHGVVAYSLRDDAEFPVEDRLDESLESVTIGEFIALVREKMGDELTPEDFKALDLGGRDFASIRKALTGELPVHLTQMARFSGEDAPWARPPGYIRTYGLALMTGGTLFDRAMRLYTTRNGLPEHAKSGFIEVAGLSGTNSWFLLNPDTETLFTGLSILAFTQTNIDNYWNTLIIPVGSTDAHFIYIDARGRVKFLNLLNYSGGDGAKFEKLLKELVGSGNIDRIVFAGSFLFGLETRKFMADRDTPEVGVALEDLDLKKHCFKSVSESTGDVLLGKMLSSRGANADAPDDYDFTFVVRSNGKGPDLAQFLGNVFNNDFMRHHLEENINSMLSFARNSLPDLCPEDVETILNGFASEVQSTRSRRVTRSGTRAISL
jgi:hypothetical protein